MTANPSPARVLFLLTSHDRLGDTGRPTGFHLGETVEPWLVLRRASHPIDLVSVRGGLPPMIGYDPEDGDHRAFLADPDAGGRLADTPAVDSVDPADYGAVYVVGGHGTMWDLPGNPAVHRLIRSVYEAGGVVAAICHGPVALVGLRLADGTSLVAGHGVTAFSDDGEQARGLDGVVPFSLQQTLERDGAVFTCAPDRQPHVVVSDRLITGQNPASAAELGRAVAGLLARAVAV